MMMFIGTETLVWPGCVSPVGGLVTHEVVVVVFYWHSNLVTYGERHTHS